MACVMLCGPAMTRHATDRLTRTGSQRRFLAAGIRVQGQWRYLVRSSNDPFTLGDESDGTAAGHPGKTLRGNHRASAKESA